MKRNARAILKRHYVLFVLTCILLGFLGVEYTQAFSSTKSEQKDIDAAAHPTDLEKRINALMDTYNEETEESSSSAAISEITDTASEEAAGTDSTSDGAAIRTSSEQTAVTASSSDGSVITGTSSEKTDGNTASAGKETDRKKTKGKSVKANTKAGYDKGIIDVIAENAVQQGHQETFQQRILGRSRGVFAGVVNGLSQGKMYVMLLDAILSIVSEPGIATLLLLVFSILFAFMTWALFKNVLLVVSRRVFLEAKIYKKVPYNRFLYFFYIRRWLRSSWNMTVLQIREFLWWLTLIGGPIKHYAYAMTPYICCEYADIKASEAIRLSRRMMKGHKFQLFLLDFSFLGWDILSSLTFGLVGIFYSNPYHAAAEMEFYGEMRRLAKENNIPGAELLQDQYLFEPADSELLKGAYAETVSLYNRPRVQSEYMTGLKKVIASFTSIVLFIDKDIKALEEIRSEKNHLRLEKACADGISYPDRLSPVPLSQHRKWVSNTNYNRYYTVWNLILMFIAFCFIGWCWEVSLHIIQDGAFVNRGMLHGPWIPIYGSGGVLILIVLTKLRKYPMAEFIAAIVLCGFLEYMTSLLVEISKGKRWWDYTGYFLNLNGRICGEGLLVFGVMGMVIVYAVAPLFDHYLRLIPQRIAVILSLVLMLFFGADCIYSHKHPNEGKGITDYEVNETAEVEEGSAAPRFQ